MNPSTSTTVSRTAPDAAADTAPDTASADGRPPGADAADSDVVTDAAPGAVTGESGGAAGGGATAATVAGASGGSGPQPSRSIGDYRIVPVRHPARWVGTAVVALIVAAVIWSFVTNPRWEWNVVASWFFAESVLRGLFETLRLTAIAGALGFLLGFVLALMRLSTSPLLAGVSWTFSWIFRSTPLLVQLLLWYNLGYLYERITLTAPFASVPFLDVETSSLMSPFLAAILGLGLHQAAYAAEIIRGGILSVDQGQLEAAAALGIPARDRSVRIVLPQAMRAILPTAFNEIIGLVKGTSIVYVLAYSELFFTIQVVYSRTQQVLPMLLVATVWYVVLTTLLSIAQYYIERHFAKGSVRTLPPTPLERIRARLSGRRGAGRPATQPASQEASA